MMNIGDFKNEYIHFDLRKVQVKCAIIKNEFLIYTAKITPATDIVSFTQN